MSALLHQPDPGADPPPDPTTAPTPAAGIADAGAPGAPPAGTNGTPSPLAPWRDVTPEDPCLFCRATAGCIIREDDSAAGCLNFTSTSRRTETRKSDGRVVTIFNTSLDFHGTKFG